MKRIVAVIACVLAIAGALMLAKRPLDVFLVAREPVPIYESEAASRKPSTSTRRNLRVDERAAVVECIDVKHYLVYKVRLSDGSVGYINDGKYSLESTSGRLGATCQ